MSAEQKAGSAISLLLACCYSKKNNIPPVIAANIKFMKSPKQIDGHL